MGAQPATAPSLLAVFQARAEAALEARLPAATERPQRLHAAMRYTTLGAGKRIRPALVYATGQMLGADLAALDGPAAALEMIHVYSLVHDDLPAMDDDDLRRGRPTCHKAFDEATAILAGDALQVLAFQVLASDPTMACSADARIAMIDLLATAAGTRGMAGGQAIDLAAVGNTLNAAEIEDMHRRKTGALLQASILLGSLASPNLERKQHDRLAGFGASLGLAFQIVDDILDVEGDPQLLGKSVGADEARHKPTYPSVIGLPASRLKAQTLVSEAMAELEGFGPAADSLRALAAFIVDRRQ